MASAPPGTRALMTGSGWSKVTPRRLNIQPRHLCAAVTGQQLPSRRLVIFQELAKHVATGVDPIEDRVDDAGCAVDDIERRMKAALFGLALGDVQWIFIGHPT